MSLLIFLLKRKRQCTNAPDTASTKQEAINKVLDYSDIQIEIVSSS